MYFKLTCIISTSGQVENQCTRTDSLQVQSLYPFFPYALVPVVSSFPHKDRIQEPALESASLEPSV